MRRRRRRRREKERSRRRRRGGGRRRRRRRNVLTRLLYLQVVIFTKFHDRIATIQSQNIIQSTSATAQKTQLCQLY
jgi:hypothetical protein